MKGPVGLLLWACWVAPAASTSFSVAAQSCATGSYYDSSSFSCVACDSTEDVTADGFGCECKAGYIRDLSTTSSTAVSPPCTACTEASSSNRLFCMTCDGTTTGFDSGTKECGCATGLGLVETDEAGAYTTSKSCTTCTAGSLLTNGVCVACSDPRMQLNTGACTCTADYVQVNDVCLHQETTTEMQSAYPSSSAYTVTYHDLGGRTLTSAVFSQWFYEAAVKCKRQDSNEYCQMLANMCVLLMYDKTAPACALFQSLTQASTNNGFSGWDSFAGFLYFAATTQLTDESITTEFSFHRTIAPYTDTVSIRLAEYAFNGTFLGWQNLTTQLALCGGEYDNIMKWTSFGAWKQFKCDLDVNSLVRANDTRFYDPYFVNSDGTLYPIPVIVQNYRDSGGSEPNSYDTAESYWIRTEDLGVAGILTRRFFLFDNLSGRETSYTNSPSVVRVIETAGFNIALRNEEGLPSRILPPTLTIKYTELDFSDVNAAHSVSTEFGISYSQKTGDGSYGDGFSFWFAIVLVLGLTLLGVRAYRFARANQITDITCSVIGDYLMIFFRAAGNIFGPCYILMALYWYIVFKMQGDVVSIMPQETELDDLWLYWAISFAGVTIGTISLIFVQVSADIFFIDWEPPRGRIYGPSQTSHTAPVSTWRTLFVANEFARIQTDRVMNFDLMCMFVLFFLIGVPHFGAPYYNASCNTPDGSDLSTCSTWGRANFLRILVDASFWILVALGGSIYNIVVVHRLFKHPSNQLLDIMSLANISAWILPDKYAGYYLHGTSALPHADTAVSDFTQLLADEEANVTSRRGLLPDSDLQEYLMFVSSESRNKYDTFLDQIRQAKEREVGSLNMFAKIRHEFQGRRHKRMISPGSGSLVDSQQAMNSLLKHFVKLMQTGYRDTHIIEPRFSQRLFDIPPERDSIQHAIFWSDHRHSWVQIMYEGIEFDLLLFNIYVFTVFDLISNNPVVAMLLTYLIQKSIDYVRYELGVKNLGSKTLIGERFFM